VSETLSNEQRAAKIAALTTELQHYEKYGNADRAKAVKAQLDFYAADAKPPAKRAAKKAKASRKKATKL
jgi:hypothetical protein